MELNEVDMVGLEALERLVDLARGRFLGASVKLSHQENLVAIPVAEGRAHATLAFAGVIVPAVVQEVNAAVNSATDNPAGLRVESLANPKWNPPKPIAETRSPVLPSLREIISSQAQPVC